MSVALTSKNWSYPDRRKAASSKFTFHAVLLELASDVDWEIRRRVALNKLAPAAALVVLAMDGDLRVWSVVDRNRNASEEVRVIVALKKAGKNLEEKPAIEMYSALSQVIP